MKKIGKKPELTPMTAIVLVLLVIGGALLAWGLNENWTNPPTAIGQQADGGVEENQSAVTLRIYNTSSEDQGCWLGCGGENGTEPILVASKTLVVNATPFPIDLNTTPNCDYEESNFSEHVGLVGYQDILTEVTVEQSHLVKNVQYFYIQNRGDDIFTLYYRYDPLNSTGVEHILYMKMYFEGSGGVHKEFYLIKYGHFIPRSISITLPGKSWARVTFDVLAGYTGHNYSVELHFSEYLSEKLPPDLDRSVGDQMIIPNAPGDGKRW